MWTWTLSIMVGWCVVAIPLALMLGRRLGGLDGLTHVPLTLATAESPGSLAEPGRASGELSALGRRFIP